jgi:hypothetical protein
MPRVKIPNCPYRISFFSFDLAERPHVHVVRDNCEAKVWFDPAVELSWNHGFSDQETRTILRLVEDHLNLIKDTYANASRHR